MSDKPVNDRLLRLIPRMGMALILGSEGSGKSNLGYGILESLRDTGRPIGVYGLPLDKAVYLPDWLKIFTNLEFPEGSIVLADEAYLALHSRASMSNPNKFADLFSGLVRQKDILAIYVSQFSRKLDIGVVASPRVLLAKQPSLLQMRLDRSQLRPILADATKAFKELEAKLTPNEAYKQVREIEAKMSQLGADTEVSPRCLIATYVVSNKFEGMIDLSNRSPSFWCEQISKAWKGVPLVEARFVSRRNAVLCSRSDCNEPAMGVCTCHGNSYCAAHSVGHHMTQGPA